MLRVAKIRMEYLENPVGLGELPWFGRDIGCRLGRMRNLPVLSLTAAMWRAGNLSMWKRSAIRFRAQREKPYYNRVSAILSEYGYGTNRRKVLSAGPRPL